MSSEEEQVRAKEELAEMRKDVDVVDLAFLDELAEFMRDRMKVVEKIGTHKRKKMGGAIRDTKREEEVIGDRATRGKGKGLSGEMVGKIFKSIVDYSREHE